MKKILLLLISFIYSGLAIAQGFDSEKETREFADSLMDRIVKKEFKAGFDEVKKYWAIPDAEVDSMVIEINQQWPIVDQRFGQTIEWEYVGQKRIGESFLRYYYLHKFENHSIYWQMDFYKPRKKWVVNQIIFLDTLEALYE